jgi:hypothetical protein
VLKVIADEGALDRRWAQMRSGGRVRCGVLSVALGDEVAAHIAAHASERDKSERRLVARHQHARPWQVITVAGAAVETQAPRVNHTLADPAAGGHRESAWSWAGLPRDCTQQGVRGPPPGRPGRALAPP